MGEMFVSDTPLDFCVKHLEILLFHFILLLRIINETHPIGVFNSFGKLLCTSSICQVWLYVIAFMPCNNMIKIEQHQPETETINWEFNGNTLDWFLPRFWTDRKLPQGPTRLMFKCPPAFISKEIFKKYLLLLIGNF